MFQKQITDREAGQRFDKYLHKLLPEAGTGFLYKMLRKKNITLNGKKADGSEKTAAGDSVELFFSEETLQKFMGNDIPEEEHAFEEYEKAFQKLCAVKIIYENDHILLADKPAGILSQKAEKGDLSLNEWLIGYLLHINFLKEKDLQMFKPSVCNRLDRNTSGIVLCAKSLKGAQLLGELLQNRTLHKYYQTFVKGQIREEQLIEGFLVKDAEHNKVSVRPLVQEEYRTDKGKQKNEKQKLNLTKESYIKTLYKPLQLYDEKTLLEVELLTGKPHQIRAHLASIGHPLLGDYKYGDRDWNNRYQSQCGVKSQLLHAYKVEFPKLDKPFEDISEKGFYAEIPEIFERVKR